MKRDCPQRASPRLILLAIPILLAGSPANAENIDPAGDGSKFAWSENLGWINLRPGGSGGPGVQVSDSALTGWAWAENAGWISLSCQNTSSCGPTSYGVTNDGCGKLGGYAWSENAGWINFAFTPAAKSGVTVNPGTGGFCGRAWSENAGWITFMSTALRASRVSTSWRQAGVPAEVLGLLVDKAGGTNIRLAWMATPLATSYDIVQGGLSELRSSAGDFGSATQSCVETTTATFFITTTLGTPSVGDGYWFLVRGLGSSICNGSYDAGDPSQIGRSDCGIAASGHDCP